jgi:RNA polymerase primary sigma factor
MPSLARVPCPDNEPNKPPLYESKSDCENRGVPPDPGGFVVQRRLTARQERDLVIAAECGDSAACRELVEAFLPAIAKLARSFQNGRVERGELLQEGVAGLLFAARRYDPELNTPFWAYASFWVRKAMQELVAELIRPVALSDRAVRDLAQIRRARHEHLQAHGSEPSNGDLSHATGLTLAQLENLQATERPPRAMEERLSAGADSDSPATIGDSIVDPAAERAYQQVLDDLEIRGVRDLTDELDERERTVIRAHYGLGERAQTLSEIGARLGLTAERARQIEADALSKLRAALANPAAVRSFSI